ncbi:hypothetical protein Baya_5315 [Bagarius yarrelli]|uniref:Uncharacterized protein n=1 Tax=Bagarius yarrelli TaxID=175774 RepID=A0A556TWF2_BAGYA|nr:hypothetical protein Baya_5315 [Bagarius yarrelli]
MSPVSLPRNLSQTSQQRVSASPDGYHGVVLFNSSVIDLDSDKISSASKHLLVLAIRRRIKAIPVFPGGLTSCSLYSRYPFTFDLDSMPSSGGQKRQSAPGHTESSQFHTPALAFSEVMTIR